MSRGTVQHWLNNTFKVSRLVGGGAVSDFMFRIEEFSQDVKNIVENDAEVRETEVDANKGGGICAVTFVVCGNNATAVTEKFRKNGWNVK